MQASPIFSKKLCSRSMIKIFKPCLYIVVSKVKFYRIPEKIKYGANQILLEIKFDVEEISFNKLR